MLDEVGWRIKMAKQVTKSTTYWWAGNNFPQNTGTEQNQKILNFFAQLCQQGWFTLGLSLLHPSIFVIIYLMSHRQPLGQQGFAVLAVYTDSLGVGGKWRLPKDPAHVME